MCFARSTVPTLENKSPRDNEFVVLVPLSNPDTEAHLITLGAAIANQRDGRVVAVNIIEVPDQTPLGAARDQFDVNQSESLLEGARRDASKFGAPIETHIVFSHQSFRQVFDTARRWDADICVMGWGPDSLGIAGRAEPVFDELAHSLPCDFLVFKDRGFDPSRVLLPTAGGPDSILSAAIARVLVDQFDANVTLLHIADDLEVGETFLQEWSEEHGLQDATQSVLTGDVQTRIAEAAADSSLLVIGATEKGLLSRLVRGSLILDILEEVDCSVLLAEMRHKRSLRERIFGADDQTSTPAETGVTTEASTSHPDHSEK